MKETNHNPSAMMDAIKRELDAAAREKRAPTALNAIALFRPNMQPLISDDDIHRLFTLCFGKWYRNVKFDQWDNIASRDGRL